MFGEDGLNKEMDNYWGSSKNETHSNNLLYFVYIFFLIIK